MADFVFVDVETTGLFSSDRIVSMAAIRVHPDEVLARELRLEYIHLVFDPGKKSHPRAEAVHGLDDWFLRHQPQFHEQADGISTIFAGSPVIAAHNVAFDRQFLQREFAIAGIPFATSGYLCTMHAYREQEYGRASLNAILPRLGLARSSEKHGAFEDAWLSFQVYRWLNGAVPLKFPQDWPAFSNAREVPSRPDRLPRRSRKKPPPPHKHLHPSAEKLKPYALLLDYVARSDGRIETEIDVLTEFLKAEEPNVDDANALDVIGHWIGMDISDADVFRLAGQVDDRDKLISWLRRIALADGEVSRAEIDAVRIISEALNAAVK